MIDQTLLDVLDINREELMRSSNSALNILSIIRKTYAEEVDEEWLLSLSLNESIARMVFHADYNRSVAISQQMLDRFPDSKYQLFIARHLSVIGRCLTLAGGRGAEARQALLKGLEICRSQQTQDQNSKRISADILHELAMNIMMTGGDADMAADYLRQAIDLLQNTPSKVRLAVCLMGLGNIMYSKADVNAALDYYLQAEIIFDDQCNFSNWASVSSNIGLCHIELKNFQLAEKYLSRSLSLRSKIGNSDEIAISFYNLSLLYERKGNIEKAILNLLACRSHATRLINKRMYNDVVERLRLLTEMQGGKYDSLFNKQEQPYKEAN